MPGVCRCRQASAPLAASIDRTSPDSAFLSAGYTAESALLHGSFWNRWGIPKVGPKMIHPMDGTARPHPSRRQRETALSRHELA